MLLVHSYHGNTASVAKHLGWPQAKVTAATQYADAFPNDMEEALAENAETDFLALKRVLPQSSEFGVRRAIKP